MKTNPKSSKIFRNIIPALMFVMLASTTQAQLKYLQDVKDIPGHPRILLLQGEEQQIKANIAADPA